MDKKYSHYTCYSLPLYYYLRRNGLQPVRTFINPKQGNKTCWEYEMTEELSRCLKWWSDNSPSRINK